MKVIDTQDVKAKGKESEVREVTVGHEDKFLFKNIDA
ncbi:50S ribosomal protein L9, partial [Staphylococcus aureus]